MSQAKSTTAGLPPVSSQGGMLIAVGRDGLATVSGGKTGEGSLMKLDADGHLLWKLEVELESWSHVGCLD